MKAILVLLALVAVTNGQLVNVCRPTEIVFLLDHSENAKKASTLTDNNPFQLLKEAWATFMNDLSSSGDNMFRIWAWAYSSTGTPIELVSRNSRPSQSRNPRIGAMSSGGSWTYTGMEKIASSTPSLSNNIVITISAQGSFSTSRRARALTAFQTMKRNTWNSFVIGAKASSAIDMQELQSIDSDGSVTILDDGRPTNKKSYSLLGPIFTQIKNQYLCPPTARTLPPTRRIPVTYPPFTRPPVTMPPSDGVCTTCKIKGGYGFDRHPLYCDSFYRCLPKGEKVLMHCGQSLIWDPTNAACMPTTKYQCATGMCDASTVSGTRYPSGGCCNMYFECNNGVLRYMRCPSNQVFDITTSNCISVGSLAQIKAYCGTVTNRFYCNERIDTSTYPCDYFSPDQFGNPCKYYHLTWEKNTPAGTAWNQTACSLVQSDVCDGASVFSNKNLRALTDTCTAILLSTFEDGAPLAMSERDTSVTIFVQTFNVVQSRGALFYNPNAGADANAYYYFFNNNQIPANSAFRVIFQLAANAVIGTEYDLLSNNYCSECPETLGVTVRKVSQSEILITTKTMDSLDRSIIRTTTSVRNINNNGWIDFVMVWGINDIHGRVNILSSNKAIMNTVNMDPVRHSPMGGIAANQCGLLLGAGPNINFIGSIDLFAFYSTCTNIDDVLTIRA